MSKTSDPSSAGGEGPPSSASTPDPAQKPVPGAVSNIVNVGAPAVVPVDQAVVPKAPRTLSLAAFTARLKAFKASLKTPFDTAFLKIACAIFLLVLTGVLILFAREVLPLVRQMGSVVSVTIASAQSETVSKPVEEPVRPVVAESVVKSSSVVVGAPVPAPAVVDVQVERAPSQAPVSAQSTVTTTTTTTVATAPVVQEEGFVPAVQEVAPVSRMRQVRMWGVPVSPYDRHVVTSWYLAEGQVSREFNCNLIASGRLSVSRKRGLVVIAGVPSDKKIGIMPDGRLWGIRGPGEKTIEVSVPVTDNEIVIPKGTRWIKFSWSSSGAEGNRDPAIVELFAKQ